MDLSRLFYPMEYRFVAETMLGKLAKWLRIMGYDVIYQREYQEEDLARIVAGGRRLLSRRLKAQANHPGVILLRSNDVGDQLRELKNLGFLKVRPCKFFTRCVICNVPLKEANPETAKSILPDFVLHENRLRIRFCPQCGRFFWPGTHRNNMLKQLQDWDL